MLAGRAEITLRRSATLLALLLLPLSFATSCTFPLVSTANVVTGLDHPWDIGFLPNRTMLDDEVNVLVRGGNYGWDPEPGYDETKPMTDLRKFPDAVVAKWSSGYPTIATSGATFLSGKQWGPWNGALLVGCLKGKHVEVLFMDGHGNVTVTQQTLSIFGRIRQPVEGLDGYLYLTTDNGNATDVIVKVTPRAAGAVN